MSSKTKQKNTPWEPAQPYILQGLQQTQRVFDQNQPQLDKYAGAAFDTYGRLAPGAERGIASSQDLVNRTIGGEYLRGNPYADQVWNGIADDVTRGVQSQFTAGGRFGSGQNSSVLARELARAGSQFRYNDYNNERDRQMQAVGAAQDLMRGNQATLDQAANLPWIGVGAQTGNVRQASQGYGTTTTTQNGAGMLGGIVGAGLQGWASGGFKMSDRRLKTDVQLLSVRPDGLGLYSYRYIWGGPEIVGVMADEVAALRPDALGPEVAGFRTVNYGAL